MKHGPYINDPGHEVPDNLILVVPHSLSNDGFYKEVVLPLKGEAKRSWFNSHYYYCLPINIGNQYGFLIKSLRDFDATWDGSEKDAEIFFLNKDNEEKQIIKNGFSNGVITIQNRFALKTSPGINIMTIQPPNMFIPGTVAMTAVVETDNIRRDFTFNLKITVPNITIKVRKGDPLGAFIPIPRYFVDSFSLDLVTNCFDINYHKNELLDSAEFDRQRVVEDIKKPHFSGRKYFNGIHAFGENYSDHQKRLG